MVIEMKQRFGRMAIAGAAVAMVATGLAAPALGDALDDAIKARRGYYQVVKASFGPLVGMAKGQIDYDAETAASFADNLVKLSELSNGHLWPAGSDNTAKPGATRSLPAIWTDGGVAKRSADWKAATVKLGAEAGNGLDALRANIGAVGNACSACHDDYRAESF
ncbi:MAG: cytochrome c [Pseudomonadota bacterium]